MELHLQTIWIIRIVPNRHLWYDDSKHGTFISIHRSAFLTFYQRKHAKSMTNYFKSYIHVELNSEMRAILVDWLIEVCEECEMDSETLFLTVNYIDRYLSAIGSPIPRHRLQLLGMTSLLIAAYPTFQFSFYHNFFLT